MTAVNLSAPVPLADLIGHCARYVSDRAIAEDFDAVSSCAASESDAAALARYRRARRQAPGYARGSWLANSHRRIMADVLAGLTESGTSIRERACVCGRRFVARRSDARSCSASCRQRRRRSGPVRRVTAESR